MVNPTKTKTRVAQRAARSVMMVLLAGVAASDQAAAAAWAAPASSANAPLFMLLSVLLAFAMATSFLTIRRRRAPAGSAGPALELLQQLALDRRRIVYSIRFGDVAVAVLVGEAGQATVVLAETRLSPPAHSERAADTHVTIGPNGDDA